MGRSKEKGKLFSELTPDELRRERARCKTLIPIYGNRITAKLLGKRLVEIEKRLARESV